MDRRGFFRRAARSTGEVIVRGADVRAKAAATRWIRPPFAVDELEFLLACTRCGECVEACPHDVIFELQPRLGVQVTGTPGLDLINKGCHLCADWPCVDVCKPAALWRPAAETASDDEPNPVLATVTIDTDRCLPWQGPECGACQGSCPVPGALIWGGTQPQIDSTHCTGCALCREACIMEPKAILVRSRAAVAPTQ